MKKNAFTLVETLIAIVIFGIGILTVLFGISKTLRNQDYASAQINSSFLAREGMELMFNLRDANYHKNITWNCIFNIDTTDNIGVKGLEYDEEGIIFDLGKTISEYDNTYCSGYFQPGTILKVGIGTGDEYIHVEQSKLSESFEGNFNNFQIYLHTGDNENPFIYNHTGTDEEKTRFARYMLITGVVENGSLVSTGDLLKIESHVLYKKGELTGEKVMETFMGNYEL